ncbi:MAG: hypothetical protein WD648_06310 [Planctomycetaceae bacterium]
MARDRSALSAGFADVESQESRPLPPVQFLTLGWQAPFISATRKI